MGFENVSYISRILFVMKELVILDLDNTLYDEKEYFIQVFSKFEAQLGLDPGSLFKSFADLDRNKSQDILRDTLSHASCYSVDNHSKLFDLYSSCSVSISLPGKSVKFIEIMRENNTRLAVLTNGVVSVQKNKVRNLNLENFVDKVFYARGMGFGSEKPDRRCFDTILKFFNVRAEDAIVIGDSYENDYLGGRSAGIESLWLGGCGCGSVTDLNASLEILLGQKK